LKRMWCVVPLLLAVSCAAIAQDGRFNLSVVGGEAFGKTSSGSGVSLDPTNSPVYVASLGMRIAPKLSIGFNFGHAKIAQKYSAVLDYRLPTTVTELSGDFTFRPVRYGKWTPFLFGGAGALVFNPNDTLVNDVEVNIGAARQYRPAFLYGGGTDYHLLSRFSARLQYRGLVYTAPDFDVSVLFTGKKTHTAEVCAGVVFNF
jgi:opacity protein-like surface antigen